MSNPWRSIFFLILPIYKTKTLGLFSHYYYYRRLDTSLSCLVATVLLRRKRNYTRIPVELLPFSEILSLWDFRELVSGSGRCDLLYKHSGCICYYYRLLWYILHIYEIEKENIDVGRVYTEQHVDHYHQ
jgi:hypothetical protein